MNEDRSQQDHRPAVASDGFNDSWHMVGHEIIAPLKAVHDLVEALERQWDAIPDDTRRAYVGTAREQMGRTLDVVRDMLDPGSPLRPDLRQRRLADEHRVLGRSRREAGDDGSDA